MTAISFAYCLVVTAYISVYCPSSTTAVDAGSLLQIEWVSFGLSDAAVVVYLLQNGTRVQSLSANYEVSANAACFTLSDALLTGKDYTVRLEEYGNPTIFGESSPFSIRAISKKEKGEHNFLNLFLTLC